MRRRQTPPGAEVLRETDHVRLYRSVNGRYRLQAIDARTTPASVPVSERDATGYLSGNMVDETFDASAIWDYGVGAFNR